MSSPAASRTPERAPNLPALGTRRSFTLPSPAANRPSTAPASSNGADGIETLFTHTASKIVSFTATSSSLSRRPDVTLDTPDSIPWRSFTERTLAVGKQTIAFLMQVKLTLLLGVLRIYRVTTSNVSFLNSGTLLHTIFPKSQCWCVDEQSIFVLRIRQDSYYRIELPFQSDEDKEKVADFKLVLAQVLQYEKTRSPFTRGFEPEIPGLPDVSERPNRSDRPKSPPRQKLKRVPGKAKKWLFDKTWVPEEHAKPSTPVQEVPKPGTDSPSDGDDRSSISTDLNGVETPPRRQTRTPSVSEKVMMFQGIRSMTTPLGLVRRTSSFSVSPQAQGGSPAQSKPSLVSRSSSYYSFHTATPGTPSPPYMDAEPGLEDNPWSKGVRQMDEEPRGRGRHRRDISEATVRPFSIGSIDEGSPHTTTIDIDVHPSSAPSTPPLSPDSEDSVEPSLLDVPTPPDTIRLKRLTGASQRRAFSPMPHPQNLFCPPTPGPRQQFTAALVRKTCELLFGPPSHLVTLMLRIAAKISQGAFGFNTYRVRHTGEKIPCAWESSDEGEWEEDDYGIPLRNLEGSNMMRRERGWSSAEID
ncbi:inheritance of peroxisomes protein 1-domain-containing protein [Clohesyomyces aquaticus]|uniref:Inheritance of peroxisomes protein 1 n=1 Tax=Clohesyomyces aquaticus TaxID=1231657 RepID=A0A1Y1ZAH6_9PLEO|nr:inheritance of peroxisomes protein 1-domain-containing protein [Clohesyomyces aquaticus]